MNVARRGLVLLAAATLASGCMALGHVVAPAAAVAVALAPAPSPVADPPGTRETPRLLEGSPRVAIALGAGSMRGFAHAGVLAALEEAGIRPDLVVGTSAGSLAGALWAAGVPAASIARASAELDWRVVSDLAIPWRGLVAGDRLEDFVRRHAGDRPIESLPTAFAAVATDARTGEAVILDRGDLARAVRASSGVPVLFEPVSNRGRLLVDGALAAPTPVRPARALGADLVIAVDVSYPPDESTLRNPVDMMFQAMQVMARNLNREELARADLVIAPDIRSLGDIGVASREALVQQGLAAGRAAVPAIRGAIEAWRARQPVGSQAHLDTRRQP